MRWEGGEGTGRGACLSRGRETSRRGGAMSGAWRGQVAARGGGWNRRLYATILMQSQRHRKEGEKGRGAGRDAFIGAALGVGRDGLAARPTRRGAGCKGGGGWGASGRGTAGQAGGGRRVMPPGAAGAAAHGLTARRPSHPRARLPVAIPSPRPPCPALAAAPPAPS